MNYEYSVSYISAEVTDLDIKKGVAWSKITAQTETTLTDMNERGWEFYGSEHISVDIAETSCFGKKTGNSTQSGVLIFIFRRSVN